MEPREEAIRIIESLYPTDSEFESTNAIGKQLLEQAKDEVQPNRTWRDEPLSVLLKYAELCEAKENKQYENAMRQTYRRH